MIYGGKGNDIINGGEGNDTIYGGQGDDYLDGGEGKSAIFGGRDDDLLIGGDGYDTWADGGEGSDVFIQDGSNGIDFGTPPVVSIGNTAVVENAGYAVFGVTLNQPHYQDVSVSWQTANGSATVGSDYTASSGTLVIPTGYTSGTISVPVSDDALDETDETFSVELSNPTNATLGNSIGTATLFDNDTPTANLPMVSINSAGPIAEAYGGTVFTVTLSQALGKTARVHYATNGGTAIPGTHYTATSGDLYFEPGATTKYVTVSWTDDTMYEGSTSAPYFYVTLSSPLNAFVGTASGYAQIINDDPLPTLSIADTAVTEGDPGGPPVYATFTFSLITLSNEISGNFLFPMLGHAGRPDNEVDLMPLRIAPPSYVDPNVPNVKLTVNGSARLWANSWKGTEIALNANDEAFVPISTIGNGITIWVEATDASNSLQDISIDLAYLVAGDTVRATGVWTELTAVETDTKTATAVFAQFPDLTHDEHLIVSVALDAVTGGTGLVPILSNSPILNTILMQYTVQPAGIQNLRDGTGNYVVSFDATRQMDFAQWWESTASSGWFLDDSHQLFRPSYDELPNDDPVGPQGEEDQSTRVDDTTHRFYVIDGPGSLTSSAIYHSYVLRFSAREWMRMGIGATMPSGNQISGSRVSVPQEWHAIHSLASPETGSLFVRSSTGRNEVAIDSIYVGLGNPSPPQDAP